MRIEKFGHCCLLVAEDGIRMLLDPGTYSRGFDALTGLAAVLVTHQHQDHVDLSRLAGLLAATPRVRLVVDEGTAAIWLAAAAGTARRWSTPATSSTSTACRCTCSATSMPSCTPTSRSCRTSGTSSPVACFTRATR